MPFERVGAGAIRSLVFSVYHPTSGVWVGQEKPDPLYCAFQEWSFCVYAGGGGREWGEGGGIRSGSE